MNVCRIAGVTTSQYAWNRRASFHSSSFVFSPKHPYIRTSILRQKLMASVNSTTQRFSNPLRVGLASKNITSSLHGPYKTAYFYCKVLEEEHQQLLLNLQKLQFVDDDILEKYSTLKKDVMRVKKLKVFVDPLYGMKFDDGFIKNEADLKVFLLSECENAIGFLRMTMQNLIIDSQK